MLAVFGICAFGSTRLSAQTPDYLTLQFEDNSPVYDPSDVWIYFDNGGGATPFEVTYNGGTAVEFGTYMSGAATLTNALSNGIQLSSLDASGFQISNVSSVAVFVSYGQFSNLSVSPGFFANSVSGGQIFQNFEITRTGGLGDQGNLTNINYFTAPMTITSYSNGAVQQQTGFTQSTAQIASQLAATSSSNAVYNTNGDLVRYVGPSTYTSNPPYPSFIPYMQSVNASGVTNSIVNSNAFNTPGPTNVEGSMNYDFTLNLTSSVQSDGTILLTGNISTAVKDNYTGITTAGPTFLNSSVTISAADIAAFNSIIYGQTVGTFGSSVTWGAGWTDFENFVNDPANNITTSGAFGITQALAIGEITSAILMGFLGNTSLVDGVPLNTMDSYLWWRLDPLQAFSEIQSNPEYYNAWASVIYTASGNTVYGIPYSDRMGTGPLVNSVQYNSNWIDTWVVGFGDPVSTATVPEPGVAGYLLLSLVALGVRRRLSQKS